MMTGRETRGTLHLTHCSTARIRCRNLQLRFVVDVINNSTYSITHSFRLSFYIRTLFCLYPPPTIHCHAHSVSPHRHIRDIKACPHCIALPDRSTDARVFPYTTLHRCGVGCAYTRRQVATLHAAAATDGDNSIYVSARYDVDVSVRDTYALDCVCSTGD